MNVREEEFGLRIKWLGCVCFEMDFGGVTVVNDPFITSNPQTELTWEAVERCDYITLTHGHYDHTLDLPKLVQKFDPCVLCGDFTAVPLLKWLDMNPMSVYPMSPGVELDFDSVKIKALYGRHIPLRGTVSEMQERARNAKVYAGDPNLLELSFWGSLEYRNYLYTMPGGATMLLYGGRLSRPDERNLLRQVRPDIAVVQMTVNSAAETAALCAEIGCRVVIPHHFDYPGHHEALIAGLGEELARRAPGIRYIVPEYGKWLSL